MRPAKRRRAAALELPRLPRAPPRTTPGLPRHREYAAAGSMFVSARDIQSAPGLVHLLDRWTALALDHLTEAEPIGAPLLPGVRPLPDPHGCGCSSRAQRPSYWGARCTRPQSAVHAGGEST